MPNIPIIRLEVEGMKYAIIHALQQHAAQMDADIQDAVLAYCEPDHIRQIIQEAAAAALNYAIKEEVTTFFRHGAGRQAVAEAVKTALLAGKTYTPLDRVPFPRRDNG